MDDFLTEAHRAAALARQDRPGFTEEFREALLGAVRSQSSDRHDVFRYEFPDGSALVTARDRVYDLAVHRSRIDDLADSYASTVIRLDPPGVPSDILYASVSGGYGIRPVDCLPKGCGYEADGLL